jgi:hypothetical protein
VQIDAGKLFETKEGRAEVLLTPGAFLRMPDQTSFTLESASLEDVRLNLHSGTVLIEIAELLPGNAITVKLNDSETKLLKVGLYRFSGDPAQIRVYDGEVSVTTPAGEQRLRKSRELTASASGWQVDKFDTDDTDPLHRWSRRRSEYIAMANRSSARSATSYASSWSGRSSGWLFNPYFGTYTFIPMFATAGSPFGFMYYTPTTVRQAYQPPPPVYLGGGGGGSGSAGFSRGAFGSAAGMPSRSATSSYSTGSVSAPSAGAAPAPAAPAAPSGPRGGGGAGARGGGSGGRQ